MKNLLFYCFLPGISFTSCNGDDTSRSSAINEKHFKPNSRLLNFEISLQNTIGDMSSRDSVRYSEIFSKMLIPMTDTVRYSTGRIYISCIKPASGCAEYQGDLIVRNDTIYLLFHNISDQACTEMEAWRAVYYIDNPEDKKYIIQKRQ
jgi:hypothetical protein